MAVLAVVGGLSSVGLIVREVFLLWGRSGRQPMAACWVSCLAVKYIKYAMVYRCKVFYGKF